MTSDGTFLSRGALLIPHRKDRQLIKPSYIMRLAAVLWDEDGAQRFRAGGGNPNLIEVVWQKQELALEAWRSRDPKSGGSDRSVAIGADSVGG